MPRRARATTSSTPVWKVMNLRKQLEDQLESVIVFDAGEELSEASHIPVSDRSVVIERASPVEQAYKQEVYDADLALIEAIETIDTPIVLPIQRREHKPSPYKTVLTRIAAPLDDYVRDDSYSFAQEWTMPVHPSVGEDAVEALYALSVPTLREEWIWQQFTPADAEHAYREQQRFFNTIRLPLTKLAVTAPLLMPKRSTDHALREQAISHSNWLTRFIDRVKQGWAGLRGKASVTASDLEFAREDLFSQTEEQWQLPVVVPQFSVVRVMSGFMGLALLVSLPAGAVSLARQAGSTWSSLKGQQSTIVASTQKALATDITQSSGQWQEVSHQFISAQKTLDEVNLATVALASLLPKTHSSLETAKAILETGEKASRAASLLTKGLQTVLESKDPSITHRIELALVYLDEAKTIIDESHKALSHVDVNTIPEEYRSKILVLEKGIESASIALNELSLLVHQAPAMLGQDHPRRYLIVFQNSSELRPTGGFMGSMAEVVLDRGMIKSLHVMGGGPYDLQGQLTKRWKAPEPLRLVSKRWEFQDANWFPDFAASAESMKAFWSATHQPTLDGIIAVNVSVIESLLEVIGPVELQKYGKTFTAQNIRAELQKAVELEYDREENKPKKIIGDLIPEIIESMKSADTKKQMALAQLFSQLLAQKEIQWYASREEEQLLLRRLGWTGELVKPIGDQSMVIGTNIAGQKSDAVITESVHHTITITEDGTITDKVELHRKHHGLPGEVFTGANNVQFIRFYAPQGSVLKEATGFNAPSSSLFDTPLAKDEVSPLLTRYEGAKRNVTDDIVASDEFDRTSFGGWIQLKPGHESVVTMSYTLPMNAFDMAKRWYPSPASKRAAFVLHSIKQSGTQRKVTYTIHVPESWKVQWQNQSLPVDQPWNEDAVYAMLFETP